VPCGGIYPVGKDLPEVCFLCNSPGTSHFCEEWDAYLHEDCIDGFLKTPEGQVVARHGHAVVRLSEAELEAKARDRQP
jgi:hypothetical protein